MKSESKPNIIKNYFYHTFTQLLTIIVPLITTPYVSRVLQPAGVGIYSYTGAISTFFTLFAALGISSYGQREIAFTRDDDHIRCKTFWELFILKSFTSILVIIIYGIYILTSKSEYKIYFIIQSIALYSVLIDISWYFHGVENFRLLAIRTTFIRLISVILIFSVVKTEADVGKYILINLLSNFVANIIMFFNLKGQMHRVPFNDLRPQRHIKGVIEFFLPVLAVQLYTHIDKVMLGGIGYSSVENGFYEQARKITEIVIKVITSINAVLFPRIAFLYAQNKTDDIQKIFKETFKVTIILLLPIITGLMVIADTFVKWFFGPGYEKVASLIRMSCPLLVFMCIGNFVGVQYLNPTKKQNVATIIYFISAIVNIVFNVFLIPSYLSMGALLASNIAELVSCLLQVILLKRSIYNFQMSRGVKKCIISAAFMGAIVLMIDRFLPIQGIILTISEIVVGAIVYFGLLILLKDENLIFDSIRKKIS